MHYAHDIISTSPQPPKPAATGIQTNHKKSAFAMEMACRKLLGILNEHVPQHELFMRSAVMTLTFAEQQFCWKEAKHELQKLLKCLARRYDDSFDYVWVQERHQSGGIHFHVLLTLPFDCRTGSDVNVLLNWKEINANPFTRDYAKDCLRFLNEDLRQEVVELRELLPNYGIGRFDILPILTDADSVIAYLTKGISRHLSVRHPEDKGARLWGCSSNVRVCAANSFSFYSPCTTKRRKQVALWAESKGLQDIEQTRRTVGRHWYWVFLREFERYREQYGEEQLAEECRKRGQWHAEWAIDKPDKYRPRGLRVA